MRHTILLLYFSLSSSFCLAQRLNTIYYGVSSDSTHSAHQLKFKNETSLELSSFPRHMSKQFNMTMNYKKINGTLEIYRTNITATDSIALINNGFQQFLSKLIVAIDGKALADELNRLVYVLHKDFKNNYYLTYIIDDKVYRQETGLTDSYGLIRNDPKENKVLTDRLTSMKEDLKNYDVKVYKGFDAYKKFGYENVFGVIELKRRK